ncbi:tRNA (adenosine(37)-N6)-threonylcarbamoyltransferase complex ATPase subunit type 1 TsaE [bacterium]|nr:tRNA (adenosine(37)-N6)-threonylcarbamoyltransferase complex ATPase subunit type 1 TsaE [bacterium]
MRISAERVHSRSREETGAFARRFASLLKPGDVVALYGDLGSGKTMLVQEFCAVLGVTDTVSSPSFAIVQEYMGAYPVYHFDFYRLGSLEEVVDIGFEEYLSSGGICFIEWPGIAEPLIPKTAIRIDIEMVFDERVSEPTERYITAPALTAGAQC